MLTGFCKRPNTNCNFLCKGPSSVQRKKMPISSARQSAKEAAADYLSKTKTSSTGSAGNYYSPSSYTPRYSSSTRDASSRDPNAAYGTILPSPSYSSTSARRYSTATANDVTSASGSSGSFLSRSRLSSAYEPPISSYLPSRFGSTPLTRSKDVYRSTLLLPTSSAAAESSSALTRSNSKRYEVPDRTSSSTAAGPGATSTYRSSRFDTTAGPADSVAERRARRTSYSSLYNNTTATGAIPSTRTSGVLVGGAGSDSYRSGSSARYSTTTATSRLSAADYSSGGSSGSSGYESRRSDRKSSILSGNNSSSNNNSYSSGIGSSNGLERRGSRGRLNSTASSSTDNTTITTPSKLDSPPTTRDSTPYSRYTSTSSTNATAVASTTRPSLSRETSTRINRYSSRDDDDEDKENRDRDTTTPLVASRSTRVSSVSAGESSSPTTRRYSTASVAPTSSRLTLSRDANSSSSSNTATPAAGTSGLVGLNNLGNTCFFNSILQCLVNTSPLSEFFRSGKYKRELNSTAKGDVASTFTDVAERICEAQTSAMSPRTLLTAFQHRATQFRGYAQQDAQECLRYLLQLLHEDINRARVKTGGARRGSESDPATQDPAADAQRSWDRYVQLENSFVVDQFVGQLRSRLECQTCHNVSYAFDPFWDLSVPIPERGGATVSLKDCLDSLIHEEVLSGDEMPTCANCKKRQKSVKKFGIERFPQFLVIHLKRFSPLNRYQKIQSTVDFPMKLDLTDYAAKGGANAPMYRLYGVCNHMGSTNFGHYTAYCRPSDTSSSKNAWFEFDDSQVRSVAPERVFPNASAYILFYEKANA